MQELDYDFNVHTAQQREADRSLAVRFYIAPLKSDAKSVESGRPIFDDTEMVEIRVRGDRNNVVQRPVREEDKGRFREAYRAFKDGIDLLQSGTPLREWPMATASMVEEMKFLGFITVEQLADASDNACAKMPGLTSLKQKAKAFLELAKGGAPVERLQAELSEEKSRREAAERQIADLASRLAALERAAPVAAPVAAKPAAKAS